jgi:hypothetical protein
MKDEQFDITHKHEYLLLHTLVNEESLVSDYQDFKINEEGAFEIKFYTFSARFKDRSE